VFKSGPLRFPERISPSLSVCLVRALFLIDVITAKSVGVFADVIAGQGA